MTRPGHLPLDLPYRPSVARGDFIVSETNRAVFRAVCDPDLGSSGRLLLSGPGGAGKSHLAAIWADTSGAATLAARDLDDRSVTAMIDGGAAVIEDADRLAGDRTGETLLFHTLNLAAAHGTRLLVTGRTAPSRWPVAMPDLASRLAAMPHLAIGPPDDTLLSSILDKLFSDRQISASADAVRFLVPRMGRSYAAALRIVTELDRRALAGQRPITRNLVREVYETEPDLITGTGEP